jgi:hypothetical protein
LLIGRHWWVAIRIFLAESKEPEYIHLCEKEDDTDCIEELEEELQPKWLFLENECYSVNAKIERNSYNPYRFDIDWICNEVRRVAVFSVEINTNAIEQHDVDVLKIIARHVAEMNIRDIIRPM